MAEVIRQKPSRGAKIDLQSTASALESPPLELKEDGYHIDDFLGYDGREFVMNAYRGILGREPDPEGLNS